MEFFSAVLAIMETANYNLLEGIYKDVYIYDVYIYMQMYVSCIDRKLCTTLNNTK